MSEPLVPASVIAKRLACSARYVLKLAENKEISCHRIGKKCVRFNLAVVERELGLTEQSTAEKVR